MLGFFSQIQSKRSRKYLTRRIDDRSKLLLERKKLTIQQSDMSKHQKRRKVDVWYNDGSSLLKPAPHNKKILL